MEHKNEKKRRKRRSAQDMEDYYVKNNSDSLFKSTLTGFIHFLITA